MRRGLGGGVTRAREHGGLDGGRQMMEASTYWQTCG